MRLRATRAISASPRSTSAGPVVHGHDGHGRVGGAVGERQALGDSEHRRRESGVSLAGHRRRRLDRDDRPVGRLVRACARTDVHHGPGIAECFVHCGGDTRVSPPVCRVADPDRVVPDPARCHRGHQRLKLRPRGEPVLPGDHELSGAQHHVHTRRVSGGPGDRAGLPGAQLAEQYPGLPPQVLKVRAGRQCRGHGGPPS
jgi:hypothetical protein